MRVKTSMFLDLCRKGHVVAAKSYTLLNHLPKWDDKDYGQVLLMKEEATLLACRISTFLEWFFENEEELRECAGLDREEK